MNPSPWQLSWRTCVAPLLSESQLAALRGGLAADDPALVQGTTTLPGALYNRDGIPCVGGCAIAYALWKGLLAGGAAKPSEDAVSRLFGDLCLGAVRVATDDNGPREFLNWFDATPRAEMIPALLAEVDAELGRRRRVAA